MGPLHTRTSTSSTIDNVFFFDILFGWFFCGYIHPDVIPSFHRVVHYITPIVPCANSIGSITSTLELVSALSEAKFVGNQMAVTHIHSNLL